jgi:hypothetical protein
MGKTRVDWVWVFPDFKRWVEAGNGDIDIHPEPALLIALLLI